MGNGNPQSPLIYNNNNITIIINIKYNLQYYNNQLKKNLLINIMIHCIILINRQWKIGLIKCYESSDSRSYKIYERYSSNSNMSFIFYVSF